MQEYLADPDGQALRGSEGSRVSPPSGPQPLIPGPSLASWRWRLRVAVRNRGIHLGPHRKPLSLCLVPGPSLLPRPCTQPPGASLYPP